RRRVPPRRLDSTQGRRPRTGGAAGEHGVAEQRRHGITALPRHLIGSFRKCVDERRAIETGSRATAVEKETGFMLQAHMARPPAPLRRITHRCDNPPKTYGPGIHAPGAASLAAEWASRDVLPPACAGPAACCAPYARQTNSRSTWEPSRLDR